MFNIQSSLLGTGWYDTCAAPTIEYAKGGEKLKEAFSVNGAGSFYLIKPDKSWEGAFLSHYAKSVAFEDVFDSAMAQVSVHELKESNLLKRKSINLTVASKKVSFLSPQTGNYSASIFSLLGKKIKELPAKVCKKGMNANLISTNELSKGSYIFKIKINHHVYNRKVILNE